MEDIVVRLLQLLENINLTNNEKRILSEIEKDYNTAKESSYTIRCPHCGKEISF